MHTIHHDAARALEKLGGDPSHFSGRQLTPKIASDADLILTMTRAHRDRVLELAPRLLRRTFLLTEAARLSSELIAGNITDLADRRPHFAAQELPDISDPIGESADIFEMVGSQIADLLPPILKFCGRSLGAAAD